MTELEEINWTEQKKKLFEELYLPLFLENGYKKRGWEFYKEIEKDKFGIVVKLCSSGNNLCDWASFYILIGLKFNSKFPEKWKKSDITLNKCEVQFSIVELLYPEEEENIELGEYWYHLGNAYKIPLDREIGSKHISESNYYGAFEGTGVDTRERISERHIKHTHQEFDKKSKLTKQSEYVYLDIDDRYDTMNIESVNKQLSEDIHKVIDFLNELNDFDIFAKKDTRKMISDKLKNKIIENRYKTDN